MNGTLADAVTGGIRDLEPSYDASPVSFAFLTGGVVRESIEEGVTGAVTVADIYRAVPRGMGLDEVPGWPVVTFYITRAELRVLLNTMAEALMGNVPFEYYLHVSGLRYVYDPARPQFDRVVAAFRCSGEHTRIGCLTSGGGETIDLEDATSLVRVAVDAALARFLPEMHNALETDLIISPRTKEGTALDMDAVSQFTGCLFNATPGDADGNGIVDASDFGELKLWAALLWFISGFSDDWTEEGLHYDEAADGIPSFPSRIYNDAASPAGQEGAWGLGLRRVLTLAEFCALPGMSGTHTLCP